MTSYSSEKAVSIFGVAQAAQPPRPCISAHSGLQEEEEEEEEEEEGASWAGPRI